MVDYAWVESLEAFCFTAVVGLDRDEVVRRLDGDPAAGEARTFEECFWAADGPQWAQVGTVGSGVLVAENNGWRAEESIERLSRDATVACFFRNVQAVMHFVYAVDVHCPGRVRPAGRELAGRRHRPRRDRGRVAGPAVRALRGRAVGPRPARTTDRGPGRTSPG